MLYRYQQNKYEYRFVDFYRKRDQNFKEKSPEKHLDLSLIEDSVKNKSIIEKNQSKLNKLKNLNFY